MTRAVVESFGDRIGGWSDEPKGGGMFSEAPELYDLFYGSFKDYAAEAEQVADWLKTHAPHARTILDVACGTGEHAGHLHADHGYTVHGLDVEPGLLEIARSKVPASRFWLGDMADFRLGHRYDAIVCLFSSIGYLCELHRVERALRCFRDHLEPGGVVLLEPWFEPQSWHPGRVYVHDVAGDGVRAVRMSYSGVEGRVSVLDMHYLIGTEERVEHRVEQHRMGLFSTPEMTECFERAGFDRVDHDPEGLIGRGMFIARTGGGP